MQTSRWPISKLPIAHLEPFPYHKGELYVELLDRLAKYVTDQLHPNLRETVEHMVEELEQILALQHNKYVEGIQDFQRIHDAFMEDVNSALMALNDNAVSDLVEDPGTALGKSLREIFVHEDKDVVNPSGDWIFTKGFATNPTRQRVGVQRDFAVSRGDRFDSRTRLEFSVRNQEGTEQNPPGYSSASIALVDEDSDIAEPYRGESARLMFVSNRFVFNKRLEVDMGGDDRAVLRSGTGPNQHIADLGLLSNTYPRITVNGYQSTGSHGGARAGYVVVDRAQFLVLSSHANGLEVRNNDSNDIEQRAVIRQPAGGHSALSFYHDGTNIREFAAYPSGTMYLNTKNNEGQLTVRGDLDVTNRIILKSANGSRFFLRVSDEGALTAVGI